MANATALTKTSLLPNNSNIEPDLIIRNYNITTVAALGTTQATAYSIGNTAPSILISTSGVAQGVRLPAAAFIGQVIEAAPVSATNYPIIYPPVGGTINFGTANAGITLTAVKTIELKAIDNTGLNFMTKGF